MYNTLISMSYYYKSKSTYLLTLLLAGLLTLSCMTNIENIEGEEVQDVSFKLNVEPILKQYCVSCHGNVAGINLSSYDAVMSNIGTNWKENIVVPGDALNSGLYDVLLERPQFQLQQMPTGGPYLTGNEIEIIKSWINEGAKNN
mgnify:FL=1